MTTTAMRNMLMTITAMASTSKWGLRKNRFRRPLLLRGMVVLPGPLRKTPCRIDPDVLSCNDTVCSVRNEQFAFAQGSTDKGALVFDVQNLERARLQLMRSAAFGNCDQSLP